ncbi:MAG: AIPR family protein [Nitrospira sp.]|nr:AIPR family protein [Nitrospira sp.]
MTQDIPEILSLFKEQLGNQISAIVKEQSFQNEGYGFAYWYFRNVSGMTDIESKDQICDGGGDLGIDAIEINDEQVVFYQFKNPHSIEKPVATGDIDRMISGLELILRRKHEAIANPELLARLEEIYAFTPSGYRIVVAASSLSPLPKEARIKLENFCEKNSGAAKDLFRWEFQNLSDVHNRFYSTHLPTLDATLEIVLERPPYMTKIGDHETYLFDLGGDYLAKLYDTHGERILQQNVRMFEGDQGTNLAIAETASSESEAKDFFHYNNGISVICDSAVFQPFKNQLSLERPQVVNGGQTMRILHRCYRQGSLKPEVHAAVRVITTGKDKEFASNVAVNLNNQTRVDNTFLRSNDPRIVQLLHSLSTLGFYLERRAGEIDAMLPEEIRKLEDRFGSPLNDHVIPLKDGMQAFVATYYGDPQLAKKDPSKIFTDEAGSFSKILKSDLTAEKFRDSYEISRLVSAQVDRFKKLKRKWYTSESERKKAYVHNIGSLIEPFFEELDQAIPQITIFGMAILFEKHVNFLKRESSQFVASMRNDPKMIWIGFIELLSARRGLRNDKSWPTLLKSGSFFRDAVEYLRPNWELEGTSI